MMKEQSFQGLGGKIFYRSWQPESPPRAVVAIAHGVLSHSGYYEWTGTQLAARGFAVFAIDHRGRGRSDGERYFIEKVDDYVTDLASMIDIAKGAFPGLPVYLLGHSAGGVVSAVYTLENQAELTGFICESFAFQVPAPGFALAAIIRCRCSGCEPRSRHTRSRGSFVFPLAVPRMDDRRNVGVALHLQDEFLPAAGIELHREQRRLDRGGLASGSHADQLMLAVATALHDHRSPLRRVEVDQGHDRAGIGQLRDERGHVFRHAGTPSIRIEVSKACVQQPTLAAGQ